MRLYFRPYLNGRTHETEARPGVWHLQSGPMPRSLLANVCDCIQDFRGQQELPDAIDDDCQRTLSALIDKFECQTPHGTPRGSNWRLLLTAGRSQELSTDSLHPRTEPAGTQWRHMTAPQITPAKNAAFYSLLKARHQPGPFEPAAWNTRVSVASVKPSLPIALSPPAVASVKPSLRLLRRVARDVDCRLQRYCPIFPQLADCEPRE